MSVSERIFDRNDSASFLACIFTGMSVAVTNNNHSHDAEDANICVDGGLHSCGEGLMVYATSWPAALQASQLYQ